MIRMDLSIQIPTHPALADTVVPEVLNLDIGTMGTKKIPIKQTQVNSIVTFISILYHN